MFARLMRVFAPLFFFALFSIGMALPASAQILGIVGGAFESSGKGAAGGNPAGPFTPTKKTYTILAGPAGAVVAISEDVKGVSANKKTVVVLPGLGNTVTLSIDVEAATLAPGEVRKGKISFNNITRNITLTGTGEPEIQVSGGAYQAQGPVKGPFAPASKTYTISNPGVLPVSWSASETMKGMSITSAKSGKIPAGGKTNLTIAIDKEALAQAPKTVQNASLNFVNQTNGKGTAKIPLKLTTTSAPRLEVTPADGFAATGEAGTRLFTPARKTYTLKNLGLDSLDYRVSETINGMSLRGIIGSAVGKIAGGGSTTITVEVNVGAETVPAGSTRKGEISFENTTNKAGNTTRPLSLTATAPPKAANDDIADAKLISGASGSDISEANGLYSMETGERNHAGTTANGRSAWWKWVAPSDGQVRLEASPVVGQTAMAVYIAGGKTVTVANITQIAVGGGKGDNEVYFHAKKGMTYYVAIAARDVKDTAKGTYTLRWSTGFISGKGLVSAVLPGARSVKNGNAATAFGTIINTSKSTASNCYISMPNEAIGASMFQYQTTDAANKPVGKPNSAVNIAPGKAQGFVFGLTPNASISTAKDVEVVFDCSNMEPAPVTIGLNTLLTSSAVSQPADMVSIADTIGKNGIVDIKGNNGTGFFVAATVNNNGPKATITASVDTGGATLPVSFTLCQTRPNGTCLNPASPAKEVTFIAGTNTPITLSVFAKGSGNIPFDPANNRAFLRFKQGAVTRGATSVAIRTIP